MILAVMASAPGLSQAAINACTTTSTITAASPSDGCSSVDLNFTNIGVSGFPTNTGSYNGTAGTINTAATPDTITTTTMTMAGSWGSTNSTATGGTVTTLVTANNGSNAPTEPNFLWALSGLTLTPTFSSFNQSDLVQAVVSICLGTGALTSASPGTGSCLAANQGQVTVTWNANLSSTALSGATGTLGSSFSTAGGDAAALSFAINASVKYTTAYISTAFTMTPSGNSGVLLTNWATGVDQTAVSSVPEPGTMGLMGLSLIGLGFLARRRK